MHYKCWCDYNDDNLCELKTQNVVTNMDFTKRMENLMFMIIHVAYVFIPFHVFVFTEIYCAFYVHLLKT